MSLVFFRYHFSYAIRKMPGDNTIYISGVHAGKRSVADVSPQVIDTTLRILETACKLTGSEPFLYARVDGIMVHDEFVLMELELIEPGLLLDVAPTHGPKDFAHVIMEIM